MSEIFGDQLKAKVLRYAIDVDGTLKTNYASRLFGVMDLSECFTEFNDKENTFTQTVFSLLHDFCAEYYQVYSKPPTEDAISSELLTGSELTAFEKERVRKALEQVRSFQPLDNEFEYSIDRLRDVYVTAKTIKELRHTAELLKQDPHKAIQYGQEQLTRLSSRLSVDTSAQDKTLFLNQFAELLMDEIVTTGDMMSGAIPYPYPMFNEILGGLNQGELVVIAGPSGLGKSFIGHDIAFHLAIEQGKKVVCADKEMLHKQNGVRFLARQTRLPSRKLRNKAARTPAEEELLMAVLEELVSQEENMLLFIPPHHATNVQQIRAEIQAHYGNEKPDFILVDYLSDLDSGGKEDGWEGIKKIAHQLKNLATYYECPVVTMAQMNSSGKDIQYGGIKQVCDTLIILSEDENRKYVPPGPGEFVGTPGIVNCFISKARNETKNVNIRLEIEYATSSIRQAPAFGGSAVGSSFASRRASAGGDD